jgi:phenol hydroxylase P1 protein
MIEELLVERDWAVGLVVLDLLDQSLYPLLYEHLDERALFRGAGPYSLLARHFHDWFVGHRKWLNALYKAWTGDPGHGEANREVLGEIVARWYPRSCEAARAFAGGIAELAGSASIVGAAERGFAELAASLTKVGVPVPTTEGAQA